MSLWLSFSNCKLFQCGICCVYMNTEHLIEVLDSFSLASRFAFLILKIYTLLYTSFTLSPE